MRPYTIQVAQEDWERAGVVCVPDADSHCVVIYDDEADMIRDWPITILEYSGSFVEILDRRAERARRAVSAMPLFPKTEH